MKSTLLLISLLIGMSNSIIAGNSLGFADLQGPFKKIEILYLHNRLTATSLSPDGLFKMYSFKLDVVDPPPGRQFVQELVAALKFNDPNEIFTSDIDCRWGFLFSKKDGSEFQIFFDNGLTNGMTNGKAFIVNEQFRKWVFSTFSNIFDVRIESSKPSANQKPKE